MLRYMSSLGSEGHVCNRLHDLDELSERIPGKRPWAKVRRSFRRRLLISSYNLRSLKYMRSGSAINYEKRRQVQDYYWMIHPFSDFRHYLRGYFMIDFITAVPFHVLPSVIGHEYRKVSNIVDVISMFRILRAFPLMKFYEQTCEAFDMGYFTYRITKIIFITCVFIHYAAALHFLVPKMHQTLDCSKTEDRSWIKDMCTPEMHAKRYLVSLYRSFCITFQYGSDDEPTAQEDVLLTMAIVVVSRILFFCGLCRLVFLMIAMHSSKTKFYAKILQLEKFTQHKRLPDHIRKRIRTFYDYRLYKTHFDEEMILGTISTRLQEEIKLHTCQKLVENVTFFNNIPIALIVRIVLSLHIEIFLPNDTIIKAGDIGTSMYFIKFGTVAVYTANGREVCHLEDGAHFGEVALVMTEQKRVATVIAVETCEVYRLDKDDFYQAISPFPDLLARIVHVANDRIERSNRLNSLVSRAMHHPSYLHRFNFEQ